jgi:hypothetical protein
VALRTYVVPLLMVWVLASVGALLRCYAHLPSIVAHILYSSSSDVNVHLVTQCLKEPHFAPLLLALLINKRFPSVAGGSCCWALPARAVVMLLVVLWLYDVCLLHSFYCIHIHNTRAEHASAAVARGDFPFLVPAVRFNKATRPQVCLARVDIMSTVLLWFQGGLCTCNCFVAVSVVMHSHVTQLTQILPPLW